MYRLEIECKMLFSPLSWYSGIISHTMMCELLKGVFKNRGPIYLFAQFLSLEP